MAETSRRAASASVSGASAWAGPANGKRVNKTFVNNALLQALSGNRRIDRERRERELKEEKERRREKRRTR